MLRTKNLIMLPRLSPIKEMEIRASKVENVVSLAQGIPSFRTPRCVKRKIIEAMEEGKTDYYSLSPGLLELREAIEYSLSKEDIFYDFEKEIIITAGSIEAITASFMAILEPGDEVIIPDPTYASFQEAVKAAKGRPVFAPLDEKRNWAFNIGEIKNKITEKTKAFLFCNPNNPTGTVYTREQLMEILELAQRYGFYVLADEVYRDFIFDGQEFFSIGKFGNFRDRIIFIFSFSKTYSMTGWRVAYLATDQKLAEKILAFHDALVTCAPVASQWGALAALEMADKEKIQFRQKLAQRRKIICRELDRMNNFFYYSMPTSAYYVFPGFSLKLVKHLEKIKKERRYSDLKERKKNSLSWIFALELLYKAKVAVVPGEAFGQEGENHIRLCFGRSEKDIIEGLKRIGKYLEEVG
jgi:aminotransferase